MMRKLIALTALVWIGALGWVWPSAGPAGPVASVAAHSDDGLNAQLAAVLAANRFTGKVQFSLEDRLGRDLNPKLADLGRLLWFDNAALAPSRQHLRRLSLADQRLRRHAVDRDRRREQRRRRPAPHRRRAISGARRSSSTPRSARADVERALQRAVGRSVRQLGAASCFRRPRARRGSRRTIRSCSHLLQAQAHIPPTELVEVAGFTGTSGTIGPPLRSVRRRHRRLRVPLPDAVGLPQRADPAGGAASC